MYKFLIICLSDISGWSGGRGAGVVSTLASITWSSWSPFNGWFAVATSKPASTHWWWLRGTVTGCLTPPTSSNTTVEFGANAGATRDCGGAGVTPLARSTVLTRFNTSAIEPVTGCVDPTSWPGALTPGSGAGALSWPEIVTGEGVGAWGGTAGAGAGVTSWGGEGVGC